VVIAVGLAIDTANVREAVFGCAIIVIIAVHWIHEVAASVWVTCFASAVVAIITAIGKVLAAKLSITLVPGAFVVVIADQIEVSAAILLIAAIGSASVVVIAVVINVLTAKGTVA
jgi:hypothetical protein